MNRHCFNTCFRTPKRSPARHLPALLLAGLLALLPSGLMPAAAESAVPAKGDYQDGIYQDLAPGYGDDVIVTVTVRNGRMVALDAKNRNGGESEYFWKARDGMAQAILQAQTPEGVEAVSGATGTSTSILAAMEHMLKQLRYNGLPHAAAGE
ncbi:MAG: FMN-binding protein [Clostridiales bacterium]|nr:FMN-binding protein [Clostridiales bacterium]